MKPNPQKENTSEKKPQKSSLSTAWIMLIIVVAIVGIYTTSQTDPSALKASITDSKTTSQATEKVDVNKQVETKKQQVPKEVVKQATKEAPKVVVKPQKVKAIEKLTKSDHVKWSSTWEITIVMYANFECQNCYVMFRIIEESWFMIWDKIKFSFRHFQSDKNANAGLAAQFVEAAWKQWKFWKMYEEVFMKQAEWKSMSNPWSKLEEYWKSIWLDIEKLRADTTSTEVSDKIKKDLLSAKNSWLTESPSVFMNWVKIENPPHKYAFMNMVTFKQREMQWLWPDWKPLDKSWTGN